ncbi:acyl-CoA dehydrogenase [Moelleriella libera RCEF 2490]|uniref:Acyl-CoA dehydrogenase n=1 Tax=Moelleriella libera RCEF 2490 TaxID=1081109 RepID=A0A167ZXQ1_9HYPO|nr:acyl-CoA dehydrogenase [Moelleriella libera RCEF 2490]
MPVDPKLHLDANIPWSEPAWLRGVPSPYYNESHRTLQRRVRAVGTDDQKRRWLPGLFARETSFSLGVTEPSGGSDVARLATTAERTPDGSAYVVNGVKKWITGTPWATHMTTAVRTRTTTTAGPRRASSPGESMGKGSSGESMGKGGSTTTTTGDSTRDGISLLVIPMDAPGVVHQKIHNSGQNAGGASYVYLENVRVPADHLLGRENDGFRVVMQNFNRERFLLTVACNRKARSCLAMALQYATRRETFGRPLVRNQVIRRKLAELAHRIEAHWAWLEQLAYQVSSSASTSASGSRGGGWDDAAIASTVALLKVQGGQLIELAAREAAQVFGGAAYQKAGPGAAVEQINRDLRMLVVGGGSEEIIADLAVRLELAMMGALAAPKL